MAKTGLRLKKKPLPPEPAFGIIKAEVQAAMKQAAERRADEYSRVTSGWKSEHQPDFQGQVVVSRNTITIRVIIKNAPKVFNRYGTTIRQLWDIWNLGSKPHVILPRFASVLRFTVGSVQVFARRVRHPGTRAHNDKEKIDARLRPGEQKAIDAGVRKGFKRLKR